MQGALRDEGVLRAIRGADDGKDKHPVGNPPFSRMKSSRVVLKMG